MKAMSFSKPLVADGRQLIEAAHQRVALAVNAEFTQLYWQIGRRVGTELLQGQRGEYGKQVVADLARQLTADFGKGWSERQLRYCVRIAEVFPAAEILHTLCAQLSWSPLRLGKQIVAPLQSSATLHAFRNVSCFSARCLRSQFVTSNTGRGGRRTAPQRPNHDHDLHKQINHDE